jgi:hypothetical protein
MSTNPVSNEIVKLSLLNGKYLTFSPSDYTKLRTNHRVVGKFIGVPVCFQRNMLWNSMPVCFSEIEAKLMLEEGLVVVEDRRGLRESSSEEVKERFAEHQEKVVRCGGSKRRTCSASNKSHDEFPVPIGLRASKTIHRE